LGVNILRSPATAVTPVAAAGPAVSPVSSPVFELQIKKDGILATAQEVDGEFTVLAGSTARIKWIGVAGHNYTGLRATLESDGTLVPSGDGKTTRFARAHVFASPSAAAAVVTGRSANGRNEWLTQGGRLTYGDWQREGVDDAVRGAEV